MALIVIIITTIWFYIVQLVAAIVLFCYYSYYLSLSSRLIKHSLLINFKVHTSVENIGRALVRITLHIFIPMGWDFLFILIYTFSTFVIKNTIHTLRSCSHFFTHTHKIKRCWNFVLSSQEKQEMCIYRKRHHQRFTITKIPILLSYGYGNRVV